MLEGAPPALPWGFVMFLLFLMPLPSCPWDPRTSAILCRHLELGSSWGAACVPLFCDRHKKLHALARLCVRGFSRSSGRWRCLPQDSPSLLWSCPGNTDLNVALEAARRMGLSHPSCALTSPTLLWPATEPGRSGCYYHVGCE
jgi:hypothetical protein